MSAEAAGTGERLARGSILDRVLGATGILSIYVWLVLVYAVEAVGHASPTIFTDELKWTAFARSIADHGTAGIRGYPVSFQSLYAYLIAPAWWFHDSASAYAAVKYLNVLAMTLAVVPAYLLARRLVSKPSALFVAAASGAVPALAYALSIVPEVIAYPWAVLCAWLIVEALACRSRRWIAAAVAASLVAPVVRGQLVVVPAAFAVAAFGLWWTSPSGRRRRAGWTRADTVGLVLLAFGVFVVFNRFVGNRNVPWHTTTDSYRGLILDQVVWASGALAIGLGILPAIGGLVSLFPRRGERLSTHDRAFIAVTPSFLAAFALYTGVKGAYLSLTFATRVTERNMIYVAPLLFLGTAIVLERRRVRLVPLAAATALVGYLAFATPLQLDYPYFEALGFSFPTLTNRVFSWTPGAIDGALGVTLAVAALALVAAWALRGPLAGRRRSIAIAAGAVLGAVVVGWNLTGQITAARGFNAGAQRLKDNFVHPANWIDRAVGDGTVTYLGQQIREDTGENLLEFWNRSIVNVWSVDGYVPLSQWTVTPNLVKTDGTLSNPPGTPYVVTDNGVRLAAPVVQRNRGLILYRIHGPIRLEESQTGVYPDGWISTDAAYNRFDTPGHRAGTVRVTLSRSGFCGDAPVGRATVAVGALAIGSDKEPALGRRWATRKTIVRNCASQTLSIPVAKPPWRVTVHVTPTFKPSDYGLSDGRDLGAVVGFQFVPER
ncbi:MAG TPA: hypothetical protein VFI37_01735 [Gaiellaceae bacterium]|nr:hypothetical protein [Gaiellaceae bacterium]